MNILQVIRSCIESPVYLKNYLLEDPVAHMNQTIAPKANKTFIEEPTRFSNVLQILCTKVWIALCKFLRKQLAKSNAVEIPHIGVLFASQNKGYYCFCLHETISKKYEIIQKEDPFNLKECQCKSVIKLSMGALASVCNTDKETAHVTLKEITKKILMLAQKKTELHINIKVGKLIFQDKTVVFKNINLDSISKTSTPFSTASIRTPNSVLPYSCLPEFKKPEFHSGKKVTPLQKPTTNELKSFLLQQIKERRMKESDEKKIENKIDSEWKSEGKVKPKLTKKQIDQQNKEAIKPKKNKSEIPPQAALFGRESEEIEEQHKKDRETQKRELAEYLRTKNSLDSQDKNSISHKFATELPTFLNPSKIYRAKKPLDYNVDRVMKSAFERYEQELIGKAKQKKEESIQYEKDEKVKREILEEEVAKNQQAKVIHKNELFKQISESKERKKKESIDSKSPQKVHYGPEETEEKIIKVKMQERMQQTQIKKFLETQITEKSNYKELESKIEKYEANKRLKKIGRALSIEAAQGAQFKNTQL